MELGASQIVKKKVKESQHVSKQSTYLREKKNHLISIL